MTEDLRPRFGRVVYDYDANMFEPLFCGPGIISVLTGHPVRTVERYVSFLRGKTGRVGGMWEREIINVLEAYGLVPIKIDVEHRDGQHTFTYANGDKLTAKVKQRPTLIRWLRETREDRGEDVYLVITTSHALAVRGEWIVDNRTKEPKPYDLAKHYRRARVRSAYCILQEK